MAKRNNRIKNKARGQGLIDQKLQIFYLGFVIFTVFAMSIAYKTSAQVWRGIHDTLVYKNSIAALLAGIAAIFFIIAIVKAKKFIIPKDKLSLSLYALVAFAAASFFWSERPGFATHKTLMWASALMLFLLCVQFVSNERLLNFLIKAIFAAGTLIAAIGLLQYYFKFSGVPQATPPASTFSNKNMACHPIVLSFTLGLYLLFGVQKRVFYKDLIYALCIAIMLAFVFHVQARAAWLSLAFELVILLLFFWPLKKSNLVFLHQTRRIAVGLGLLLLLLLMSLKHDPAGVANLNFTNPIAPIFKLTDKSVKSLANTASGQSDSFVIRRKIWAATLEVIKEKPLIGQGMGNFYIAYTRHHLEGTESIRRAHNDYLEMIAEIGLIGFAIFIVALIFTLLYLFRLIRSEALQKQRLLLVAIMAMFGGTAVNAFFSFPYFHVTPGVLMGIYMAILVGFNHQLAMSKAQDTKKSEPAWAYDAQNNQLFAFLVTITLAVFSFIALRAVYHVEHYENLWSGQVKKVLTGEQKAWQHMKLGEPRWLETTHYGPVLYGIYGALIQEINNYNSAINKEQDFKRRIVLQKNKLIREQLASDIEVNSNQYRPQLSFLLNRARFLSARGEYAKAIEKLEQAQQIKGRGNFKPDFKLVDIINKSQGKAAALQTLDKIVQNASADDLGRSQTAYLHIGFNYYRLGELDKAIQFFDESIKSFPKVRDAYKNIALIHISRKETIKAIPYMQQYIELPDAQPSVKKHFEKTLANIEEIKP